MWQRVTYAIRPYATEYVKGIMTMVTKAGRASPMNDQFTLVTCRIIIQPTYYVFSIFCHNDRAQRVLTRIKVQPVAQGGIDAKIGAKKIEIRKQIPVVIAVRPVLPPSVIPAPDSMNAVTGEQPNRLPIEIVIASVQYASVDLGKSPVSGSTTPEKRAILYSVAVQSIISTYRKVKRARAN
jgi:hypothetical protein